MEDYEYQTTIFDVLHGRGTLAPLVEPRREQHGAPLTIDEAFAAFHGANPHVYSYIVEIALELARHGFKQAGIALIFERLRWLYAIHTGDDRFKLNNNYRACYARLVMASEPELYGFFRIRKRLHPEGGRR